MMVNTGTIRFSGNLSAQDWWGYYNGKANTELVPQIWLKTYSSSVPGASTSYRQYDSARRLERQKDKDGKVVEQYTYSPLNGSGITLPETETDVPVVVQFTGISQSGSTASAQIVCTGDCQVTFYLMGEANEGMAEYMLDGHYYSYTGAFGDYVTLNLTEGSHSFSASVSGSGFASLYINAVDAPNTLGSNLSIQANN